MNSNHKKPFLLPKPRHGTEPVPFVQKHTNNGKRPRNEMQGHIESFSRRNYILTPPTTPDKPKLLPSHSTPSFFQHSPFHLSLSDHSESQLFHSAANELNPNYLAQKLITKLKYSLYKIERGWQQFDYGTLKIIDKNLNENFFTTKNHKRSSSLPSSTTHDGLNSLEALGLAATLMASKMDLEKELAIKDQTDYISFQASPPSSTFLSNPSSPLEHLEAEAALLLTHFSSIPSSQTYLKFKQHFHQKLYPNLSEFGSGLWDHFWESKEVYDQQHPENYGQLGRPIFVSVSKQKSRKKLESKPSNKLVAKLPVIRKKPQFLPYPPQYIQQKSE